MVLILLHLTGGVALLSWGLHMVESGLMRAFGAALRQFMAKRLGNRFSAFFAGLAVTGALQSSTATGLIATSFAARGLMKPVTGLAIMLGANVGSTLIVQAFSLDLSWISPVCLVIGMGMFEKGTSSRTRDVGRTLIGLGLMLLALTLLVGIMRPAQAAPALRTLLDMAAGQPLVNAAIACALTWAAHSSIPVVLFVMSLASSHAAPLSTAVAMVLGANVGSALNPFFEGARGGDNCRKRLPAGNLLLRGGACLLLLACIGPVTAMLKGLSGDPAHTIANFHTGLNIVIAALCIGVLTPVSGLLAWLLPERARIADPDAPRYLDAAMLGDPAAALACALREVMHMSEIVEDMLQRCLPVLLADDRRSVSELMRRDDAVDKLHEAIKLYVTSLTRAGLSLNDHQRAAAILTFVINLEHIGDIIDKNLMELAQKKIKAKLRFSSAGTQELRALHSSVVESFQRAQTLFVSSSAQTAQQLLGDKHLVRQLERRAADQHLQRLREGLFDSISSSALHLDVLRDLKRIHSHVCAMAYPFLERCAMPA